MTTTEAEYKIYKYPLELTPFQKIKMPPWRPLSIQMQNGVPTLWALVKAHLEPKEITIAMFGTGCSIPIKYIASHIGTVIDGDFVWHFFFGDE